MLTRYVKNFHRSFSAKITGLMVISVIVTSVVVGLATTRSTASFLSEKTSEKFPSILISTQSRVRVWYDRHIHELERLAKSAVFQKNLDLYVSARNSESDDPASRQELHKYLRLVLDKFPAYNEIVALSAEGDVITSAAGSESEEDFKTHIQESASAPYVSDPVASEDRLSLTHWILVPLDRDRKVYAWIAARVDMREIGEALLGVSVSDRGDLYVLDSLGRFLTQPRHATKAVLMMRGMQVPTRPKSDAIVVERRNNYEGRSVFRALIYFEESKWWLVYEEDYAAAMAPVLHAQHRIWVLVVIIGAIAILVSLRIARSVLKPILNLAVGARRINEGLVGVKIPPGPDDEVGLLIETFNEMAKKISLSQAELQYKNKIMNSKNDELELVNCKLEELSVTDGLTGLFNHRHFWNLLNTELTRVDVYNGELALVIVDLDDFKRINDQFGHSAGDLLLQSVARILRETVRDTDIVARYGGEEFAVLLPDTDRRGVESVSEKIRASVESMKFAVPDTDITIHVTVSVGVSVFKGNRREFFNAADKALYQSKADGKNQVHYSFT